MMQPQLFIKFRSWLINPGSQPFWISIWNLNFFSPNFETKISKGTITGLDFHKHDDNCILRALYFRIIIKCMLIQNIFVPVLLQICFWFCIRFRGGSERVQWGFREGSMRVTSLNSQWTLSVPSLISLYKQDIKITMHIRLVNLIKKPGIPLRLIYRTWSVSGWFNRD